jgi:DNA repair photolyase
MSAPLPVRGRGARSNATGRFESRVSEAFDDGWTELDAEPTKLTTVLQAEKARRIITKNGSPDISFDRSINPYRGCEHGCIYCYARPAHAYMGLSPGLDFESKLFFKPEAAKLFEAELSKPGYRCQHIHIGGNTDPYQPIEKKLQSTRSILEVADRFSQPISIITKNNMIVRDADILGRMAERGLAKAAVSITTLDRKLARSMEPRASTPEKRLEAVERLTEAGVPVSVGFSPCIPGLNDHEMEAVLERAKAAGATSAMYVALRLPWEIKDLFREWLETDQPGRASKIMSLVRQMRGGKDYDATFGKRSKGEGPVADMMAQRFQIAVRRLGLNQPREKLDVSQFRVPGRAVQMDLF